MSDAATIPASFAFGRPSTGTGLVCLAAILWATVGVASQLSPTLAMADPAFTGTIRTALGAAVLVCIAAMRGRLTLPPVKTLLIFGAAGAVFQTTLFSGFALAGVTLTVAVTVCLPPVLIALWDCITGHNPGLARLLPAIALSVAGVLTMLAPSTDSVTPEAAFDLLAASVAFSVIAITSRSLCRGRDSCASVGCGLAVSAMFLAGITAATGTATRLSLGVTDLAILAYVGLIATGGAYLAFSAGMRRASTLTAGMIATLVEPVVAAALAAILLGEVVGPREMLGCAAVLSGLFLSARATR